MKYLLLIVALTTFNAFSFSQTSVDVYTGTGKTGTVIITFAEGASDAHITSIEKQLSLKDYIGKLERTGQQLKFVYRQSAYNPNEFLPLLKTLGLRIEDNFEVHSTTPSTPKK